MSSSEPYFIEFSRIGEPPVGYISVAENKNLPFEVKRVYWTYFTPESVSRGRHAHHNTEQILIAVSGRIIVDTVLVNGTKNSYTLDNPHVGLYVPPLVWHTMKYTHYSTQLVLASAEYQRSDYISDFDTFLAMNK